MVTTLQAAVYASDHAPGVPCKVGVRKKRRFLVFGPASFYEFTYDAEEVIIIVRVRPRERTSVVIRHEALSPNTRTQHATIAFPAEAEAEQFVWNEVHQRLHHVFKWRKLSTLGRLIHIPDTELLRVLRGHKVTIAQILNGENAGEIIVKCNCRQ